MANNVVNIYKFGDFRVSPVGDIILDNGAPVVINGAELLHQEVRLLFKNIININQYLGYSAIGEEGASLGKIIQEDVDAAIASNDILKEINLSTDVYPLPNNSIKIDIYYTDDLGETIPVDGTVLDFTSGIASDITYTPPSISDIYDITKPPILQTECLYITEPTTVFEIKHPPLDSEKIYVIDPSSYDITDLESNFIKEISDIMTNVTINTFDHIYIDDIFPSLQDGSGNIKNIDIQNIYFIDSNNQNIPYLLDGYKVQFLPTEPYISDITVVMQYILCETYSNSYTIDENKYLIPEDMRMIFPYNRLFGKVIVMMPTLLQPGNYVAIYKRYPVR